MLISYSCITEYPSLEKATAPYSSPAYQEALKALGDGLCAMFGLLKDWSSNTVRPPLPHRPVEGPAPKLGRQCFIVHDADGHALAYFEEPGTRRPQDRPCQFWIPFVSCGAISCRRASSVSAASFDFHIHRDLLAGSTGHSYRAKYMTQLT